jgi:glycolate oxidase iron-sulfur subunit
MSATLPVLPLDSRVYDRALSCVHCGLCLAACPTYIQTAHEADSPRGRIQLIRGLADGIVSPTPSVRNHLDTCLDCRACESACPSNVVYHELIEAYRIGIDQKFPPSQLQRLYRWLCFHILVHPTRLKLALLPVRLLQRIDLFKSIPPGPLWPRQFTPQSTGAGKATVALFPGCVGSVMFDSVNRKAAALLNAAGANVISPPSQTCCGAIHYHGGAVEPAEQRARQNINAIPLDKVDFIVSTAAGCGAMLKEYDLLLRDDPNYAQRAVAFASKVRDITQVLDELGLPPMTHSVPITATYHDACHLAHAQKVKLAPRKLLAQIPGLKLIPLPESDTCCGAAGTYFLTQPEMAQKLAQRKLANIAATGAGTCIAANAGCALHLQRQAAAHGKTIKVVHPVDLLYAGMFGEKCP